MWSLVDNPYHGAYYRPLTNLVFYAVGKVAGLDPFWYYVSSIALHAAATWAVFAVVYELVGSVGASRLAPAAIGALVFAVHPRHVESVAYVHDNENILCGLFFFWGLYCGIRWLDTGRKLHLAGMGCAYLLSLLGKEMGITLPVVWALYAVLWRRGDRAAWYRAAAVTGGVLALYFVLRLNGLGELVGGVGETGRLEFSPARMARTLAQAGVGMVVPNGVPGLDAAADYFRQHLALFAAVVAAAFAGAGYALWRCWSRSLGFGALLAAVTALPILNNGISVEQLTGGRYLYIPLLGLALVVADLWSRLSGRVVQGLVAATLVGTFATFTARNNALVAFAADSCEGVLRGMEPLVADDGDRGEFAVLVPGFYRGLYVMGSSLQPGLELLYGAQGKALADRVALVLKLQIEEPTGLGVNVRREGNGLALECRGGMGILWKAEFAAAAAERGLTLDFAGKETVNMRGDFVAHSVAIKPVLASVVVPDFGAAPGVTLHSF